MSVARISDVVGILVGAVERGIVSINAAVLLAGPEGLGRIPFENDPLANSVCSVALALILFDGGLGAEAAAAVFSVLRTSGLKLPERLTATLEVESGSNDPMAIFLTLGLIGVISGSADSPQALLLLALAFGLVAFGLAAVLGGSGFMTVCIAGIVLGSSSIVFRRGSSPFTTPRPGWASRVRCRSPWPPFR